MKLRRVFVSPFGEITLPDDFPFHIFRKDGWWDRRYRKDLQRAQAFIAERENELH